MFGLLAERRKVLQQHPPLPDIPGKEDDELAAELVSPHPHRCTNDWGKKSNGTDEGSPERSRDKKLRDTLKGRRR